MNTPNFNTNNNPVPNPNNSKNKKPKSVGVSIFAIIITVVVAFLSENFSLDEKISISGVIIFVVIIVFGLSVFAAIRSYLKFRPKRTDTTKDWDRQKTVHTVPLKRNNFAVKSKTGFCPECGAKIDKTETNCSKCGRLLR